MPRRPGRKLLRVHGRALDPGSVLHDREWALQAARGLRSMVVGRCSTSVITMAATTRVRALPSTRYPPATDRTIAAATLTISMEAFGTRRGAPASS